jgi:hypothetical protein
MVIRRVAVSVGLFAMAIAVGFVVAGGSSNDQADAVDQAPATTIATPTDTTADTISYFVDPNETLVAASAFVPVELEIREDSVNLDYDVVSLAPNAESIARAGAAEELGLGFGEAFIPVLAIDWRLTTTDGVEITASITNPDVTIVRFPTETTIDPSDIASVEIVRYLVATPIEVGFTLSDTEPSVEVFPGATATLARTTQQGDQTIVLIDAETDVPIQATWMHISGDGPNWRSSVTGAPGGGSWSLAWVGGDLPSEIPLRVVGTAWIEGPGPVDVSLEGVR